MVLNDIPQGFIDSALEALQLRHGVVCGEITLQHVVDFFGDRLELVRILREQVEEPRKRLRSCVSAGDN